MHIGLRLGVAAKTWQPGPASNECGGEKQNGFENYSMVWVAVDGGVSSSADGVCHYVVVSCSPAQWRIIGDCLQPLPLVPAILALGTMLCVSNLQTSKAGKAM